jgi:hypothetical protein
VDDLELFHADGASTGNRRGHPQREGEGQGLQEDVSPHVVLGVRPRARVLLVLVLLVHAGLLGGS